MPMREPYTALEQSYLFELLFLLCSSFSTTISAFHSTKKNIYNSFGLASAEISCKILNNVLEMIPRMHNFSILVCILFFLLEKKILNGRIWKKSGKAHQIQNQP